VAVTVFGRYVADLMRQRAGMALESVVEPVDEHAVPDFDGGARQTAPGPLDMNRVVRQAAGFGW
jgi:hypothetical protein